jgi:hypothetical protein
MTLNRAGLLIGLLSILGFVCVAEAAPSKHVQQHCVQDYKKFCGEWGIESKGLKNCMHKHGDNLTHACVAALVSSGEVSQAEVARRKAAKGQ